MSSTETVSMHLQPEMQSSLNSSNILHPSKHTNGEHSQDKYAEYLPTFDPISFKEMPVFEYSDPALRVKDRSKPNLLTPGVEITHLAPGLGTSLSGVQLTRLNDAAKDELALLIAERKVVVFEDQDFIDIGPGAQAEFMSHFGVPNYQPISPSVRGHPSFHIVHRKGNKAEVEQFFEKKSARSLWHQDASYEIQPPGYVMIGLFEAPPVGGDTLVAAADLAYERLSPTFRTMLDPLKVTHTSKKMIETVRARGGLVRREPIDTVHPLIRVHPVTGRRSIFLNGEVTTSIQGMREDESALLIDFLMRHLIEGHDFQTRVRWKPRMVVMFDNRNTIHSGVMDYIDDNGASMKRHLFRLCATAEVPIQVVSEDK